MKGPPHSPNIGPRERRKRLAVGVVSLAVALAGLAALLLLEADRGWRLLLVLPLWGATLGFYQHREKT